MVLGGIRSVEGGTGLYMMVWGDTCWCLVVLDQQRAVMVDIMVFGRHRAVLVGT